MRNKLAIAGALIAAVWGTSASAATFLHSLTGNTKAGLSFKLAGTGNSATAYDYKDIVVTPLSNASLTIGTDSPISFAGSIANVALEGIVIGLLFEDTDPTDDDKLGTLAFGFVYEHPVVGPSGAISERDVFLYEVAPYSIGGVSLNSATDLRYSVSPISAVGTVPEPASWAMLIGGFGLAGGAARRRRTTTIAFN